MARTVKDFWKEFCTTTGIRGFSFIVKSICTLEEWFWGVMVLICAIMTVYDISISVMIFLSYPTATKVVVHNNDSISLGAPTICIDIDIESLDYGDLDLGKPETIVKFLQSFETVNVEEFLLDEFYKMRNKSAMHMQKGKSIYSSDAIISDVNLASDSRISVLTSLTTAMIGAVVRHESLIREDFGPTDYNWGVVRYIKESEEFYVESAYSAAIYEVYKFYMRRNCHLKNLHKLAGALLCQMTELNMIVNRRNDTTGLLKSYAYSPCDPTRITWLGIPPYSDISREVVCLRLSLHQAFHFSTPEEKTIISLDQSALFHRPDYYAEAVRIDFSQDPSVTHRAQNLLWVLFGNHSEVTVAILGHFKQLQSAKNPCTTLSHTQCRMACRAKYIAQYCYCRSLSLLEFSTPEVAHLPVCAELNSANLTEWEKLKNDKIIPHLGNGSHECLDITNTYRPYPECSKKCTRNCQYKIYSYNIDNWPGVNNWTSVTIFADPFVYPHFEEYQAIEARQFLGTLGGNLSFWFGASFLVLLHVVVFILRIPIEYIKSRPRKSVITQATANVIETATTNFHVNETKTENDLNSNSSTNDLMSPTAKGNTVSFSVSL